MALRGIFRCRRRCTIAATASGGSGISMEHRGGCSGGSDRMERRIHLLVPRKSRLWMQWEFCALLSIMQPIPDLFLVKCLGSLQFDPAPFRIGGEVPASFLGMWTIALIPVVHLAGHYGGRNISKCTCLGALISAVWFFGIELLCKPLRLWHPTPKVDVVIGNCAIYVLVAETALGAATPMQTKQSAVKGLVRLGACVLQVLL